MSIIPTESGTIKASDNNDETATEFLGLWERSALKILVLRMSGSVKLLARGGRK